jgi:hypothetical protein
MPTLFPLFGFGVGFYLFFMAVNSVFQVFTAAASNCYDVAVGELYIVFAYCLNKIDIDQGAFMNS